MSTLDQIIADAQTAEDVLATAAPFLASSVPVYGAAASGAITISGEVLAVIKAIVSWAEAKGLSKAADVAAVTAIEGAADAAEKAKFGS